eukprot:gene7751-930_t
MFPSTANPKPPPDCHYCQHENLSSPPPPAANEDADFALEPYRSSRQLLMMPADTAASWTSMLHAAMQMTMGLLEAEGLYSLPTMLLNDDHLSESSFDLHILT